MEAPGLQVVNISDQAAQLKEPFTMVDLAQIDDLVLSVYLCQGTMPYHRHVDQDELFLVHAGTISLDSEWGNVILHAGEMVMVPKSLAHRSSSMLRSLVLILQPRIAVDRRNGDRRLFMPDDEKKRLEKLSVPAMGRQLMVPYQPILLAHVDTVAVHLALCSGNSGWHQVDRQATLVQCCDGRLSVETEGGRLSLGSGELLVIPAGVPHRLSSTGRAVVLGLTRHRQPTF
jgi:mannose-6-phosphate isomerase-like protein (cupin superfamily)